MKSLKSQYLIHEADIHSFAKKAYNIWQLLPSDIASVEPFHILSYADDPLSWGDERQCRELYEEAFDFYEIHK